MTVHVTAQTAKAFGAPKRHKYGARAVSADGYKFDSSAEYKRYCELKLLEKSALIAGLKVHPRYPLIVLGKQIATYVGDFAYCEPGNLAIVCEDVKGVRTQAYVIKSKLLLALYPEIDFRELKA